MRDQLPWFQEIRLDWIKESLEIFGAIRRQHVMKKFRISAGQAAVDFRVAKERWPGLMEYDTSAKTYRVKDATTGVDRPPISVTIFRSANE